MLPTIDRPVYTTNITSQTEPVKFTPYTVRESLPLLMAKESGDAVTIVLALKQVVSGCLLDKTIDIDKLPMVDLEWLFIQIHARSAGERIPLYFKCTNAVNGANCGMMLELELNLLDVKVNAGSSNNRIELSPTVGMMMRYPTFEVMRRIADRQTANVAEDTVLAALCIESIWDEKSVYAAKDATVDELVQFVSQLPPTKYELVEQYFRGCPTIKHHLETKCPKCGYEHKIDLEGLEDFFG